MNRIRINKILVLIAFTLMLFAVWSCNSKTNKKADHSLEQIKKRGKLVALTGYNAYSYFIYKGKPMGFEYELLKRFSKRLGVDLEIKVVKNINEMFTNLENGDGDLIAFNLTITNERKKQFDFTHHINTTQQVLVQRKPKNWRRLTLDQINDSLIKSPIELEGKTVYVRSGSAYLVRLKNLVEESGSEINIIVADEHLSTEDLIENVATGEIDYTVADENFARLNKEYLPILDVETHISFPQKIAWAVNKNSNQLLTELNNWIDEFKKELDFHVIYERYYEHKTYYKNRRQSKFLLKEGGEISEYDNIIRKNAKIVNWDWRLIAALIYQESKFNPDVKSWAGAMGLMQLLPETGEKYGVEDLLDPKQNIEAGVKYLKWLDDYWAKEIEDKNERIKFVLASYNLGYGHIEDAKKLTEKFGADPNVWENNVETYLKKKSTEKFYSDEVVKNGYCQCIETIKFVKEILQRFERYKQFVN